VTFTVNQLAPVCRAIGHFTVIGHAGLNRVRFAGRVHRRALPAGTYRISARIASGQVVRRITLVVATAAPTRAELRALRALNVCVTEASSAPTAPTTISAGQARPRQNEATAGIGGAHGPNLHSGVLASTADKAARVVKPFLVGLLAAAIVFLSLASAPGAAVVGPRLNDVLARHRLEFAGLGVAALGGAALAFLL